MRRKITTTMWKQRKTTVGRESIEGRHFTVEAMKRRNWTTTYEVLVESNGKRLFWTCDSFQQVHSKMRKDGRAKKGLGLLMEVAMEMNPGEHITLRM